MPEFSVQTILLLVGVGLLTAVAAAWDFRWHRIPNKLTVPAFFLGLVYQGAFNGWPGLSDAGLGFLTGFGTLFVLWLIGGGGGGDVKLMGALSVWLGFKMTLLVLILSTVFVLAGTVFAISASIVSRGFHKTKKKYLAKNKTQSKKQQKSKPETTAERQKRRIMAYAVPVAVATWLVMIWKLPSLP